MRTLGHSFPPTTGRLTTGRLAIGRLPAGPLPAGSSAFSRSIRGLSPTVRRKCRALRLPMLLVGILLAAGVPSPLSAQDPFGGAGGNPFDQPPAANPPGGPAANPFGAPPGAGPAPAAADPLAGPAPRAAEETDPVVLAIRESNPQTPREWMRAAQAMIDYGRPDEAQRYLQALLAAKPDANELAALAGRFGSALFMRLARNENVQPEGAQLAQAVLQAAQQMARDPRRLAALVRQLDAPSAEQRQAALNDLRAAGLTAVNPLLAALRDPDQPPSRASVSRALEALGPLVVEPLTAALETGPPEFQAALIGILGRLRAPQAVPFLVQPAVDADTDPAVQAAAREALRRIVGAVPERWEVEAYLRRRVRELIAPTDAPENAGTEIVWSWDADQQAVVSQPVGAGEALALTAARWAEELYELESRNPEYRRWALANRLEYAKRSAGFHRPLPRGEGTIFAQAAEQDPAVLEDVLAWAIEQRLLGAAIGAAEVLGETASPELLRTDGLSESPLVAALRHRNRRLRFAAAMAILKIDPQSRYPGSSFLAETLGWLASTTGTRRALIVHPRPEYAQSLAGLLAEVGYDADSAQTGSRAILLAARQSDLEFILVSPYIDGPRYQELVERLRRNVPTATMPVGILARPHQLQEARDFAERDPLTRAFPRPHDAAAISFLAAELLSLSPVDQVPLDERLMQASAALDGLLKLAGEPRVYGFYDILRQEANIAAALNQPALAERAVELLGILGTPTAQRLLVDVASQRARPLDLRRAALEAFRQAVERRGVLLTTDEILVQYDRYNQSATLDEATQRVLGSLLDVLETRSAPTSRPADPPPANAPSAAPPPGDAPSD